MKFTKLNKKGTEIYETTSFSLYLPIILLVLLAVFMSYAAFSYASFTQVGYVPEEYKMQIIANRFFSSSECFAFAYEDLAAVPITQSSGWTVDLDKFNQEQLDNCYVFNSKEDYQFGVFIPEYEMSLRTGEFYSLTDYEQEYLVRVFKGGQEIGLTRAKVTVQNLG